MPIKRSNIKMKKDRDMELKVYDKMEKPTFFKLREYASGIQLEAVNSDGEKISRGTILAIDAEGLHLKKSINKGLGLPLNKNGMVKVCTPSNKY